MAQAVEQLELRATSSGKPNPSDRRSQLVFLTQRGKSIPPVTHAAAARVEERWAALTSRNELEAVREVAGTAPRRASGAGALITGAVDPCSEARDRASRPNNRAAAVPDAPERHLRGLAAAFGPTAPRPVRWLAVVGGGATVSCLSLW